MNKRNSIILFLGIFALACGLIVWATNSPIVDDYYWVHNRDTESNLALAFTISLRTNHPAAYDIVDPSLKPRLDEWMNVHQSKKCTRKASTVLGGLGTKAGKMVIFSCRGENNKRIKITVDNIVIKDMKVIDWGEVIEEYD
jgi:hypothetical protein